MIYFYEQVDSTNRIAKEMAKKGAPDGAVVVAACQSAGRGQYERIFNSPLGGLYFSLVIEPFLPPERIPLITLATGLACSKVLHETFHINTCIKWPNDIFLGEKKVAGILCEYLDVPLQNSKGGKVIVGVGLNVNSRIDQFDPEVQLLVTTLFEHTGKLMKLKSLLDDLLRAIISSIARISVDRDTMLKEWQSYDMLKGHSVSYTNQRLTIEGIGNGITLDGLYRIRDDKNREHTIVGGQLRLTDRSSGI